MFDSVRSPVRATTRIQESTVGYTGEPLDFTTGIDILLIFQEFVRIHEQRTNSAFNQVVRRVGILFVREIAFQQMRKHVRNAHESLVCRQAYRVFRVHNGKLRDDSVVFKAELPFTARKNRCVRSLGTARSCRCNHANRQNLLGRDAFFKEIPHIAVIRNAKRHRFCRINGASAAHSKHKVHLVFLALLHEFAHQVNRRVRNHIPVFGKTNPEFRNSVLDHVVNAERLDKIAAVNKLERLHAVCSQKFAKFLFAVFAKNNLCWIIIFEVNHVILSVTALAAALKKESSPTNVS